VPQARTFAILACDSESSRPNVKMIEQLAQRGSLPLKLADKVLTNSLDEFKSRALALSKQVDAFFVLNHDTLRDAGGSHVDMLDVGRWYLQTIRKPEASHEDQFVLEGMLLTANDSGYNQGFLAFEMAHGIPAGRGNVGGRGLSQCMKSPLRYAGLIAQDPHRVVDRRRPVRPRPDQIAGAAPVELELGREVGGDLTGDVPSMPLARPREEDDLLLPHILPAEGHQFTDPGPRTPRSVDERRPPPPCRQASQGPLALSRGHDHPAHLRGSEATREPLSLPDRLDDGKLVDEPFPEGIEGQAKQLGPILRDRPRAR
jgi:hypothetical protein